MSVPLRGEVTPAALASLVALNLAGPKGKCPAWMEAAERRCSKLATVGLLCQRHHTTALKRAEKVEAANAAFVERRRANATVRLPLAEAELTAVRKRIAALDPTLREDGAIVNLPLSRRMPSDSRIAELSRLVALRDRLAGEVAGLGHHLGDSA